MGPVLPVALFLALSPAIPAPQDVSGVVFEDIDRDGERDPGEPGLPGLSVSLFGNFGSDDVSTTTDGAGSFSVALSQAWYMLELSRPTGLRPSAPLQRPDLHPIPDFPKGRRRGGSLEHAVGLLRQGGGYRHVGLGDSIAFGFNLCDSIGGGNNYLAPLTARINNVGTGATLDKVAVGGYETSDLLNPAQSGSIHDAINQNADLVTISIGGNDFLSDDGNEAATAANLAAARQNIQEILSTLLTQLPNSDVIINTVYDNEAGQNPFHNRWGERWNQALRDLAFGQVRPVAVAEVYPDYDHLDATSGENRGHRDLICQFFGLDEVHPIEEGYDVHEEKNWQGIGGLDLSAGNDEARDLGHLQLMESRSPTQFQDLGGGATSESEVFLEDGTGAIIPAGNEELRVFGFDATPTGLLQQAVVRVRYRTTAGPVDDAYRMEASVDGAFSPPGNNVNTWNTVLPIVGGAGNSGAPILAFPDAPLYREVSTLVTAGSPADGSASITWQDLATLTVRLKGLPTGASDAFAIEWDSVTLDLYGVAPHRLLIRGTPALGSNLRFDVTGVQGSLHWLYLSTGTGNVPFPPWGTWGIDLGQFWLLLRGLVGSTGAHTLQAVVPNDPTLVGLTFYFQSLVVQDFKNQLGGLTNVVDLTFE